MRLYLKFFYNYIFSLLLIFSINLFIIRLYTMRNA